MKKSEFLNKTREELLTAWNEIKSNGEIAEIDLGEEADDCLAFIEMLLNNEMFLKALVNTKEDRKTLLTLAESVKSISKVFKNAMQKENYDEYKFAKTLVREIKAATKVANKRSRILEKDLQDDMGEIQISGEEVIDSIFEGVEKLGVGKDGSEAIRKEVFEGGKKLEELLNDDDVISNLLGK